MIEVCVVGNNPGVPNMGGWGGTTPHKVAVTPPSRPVPPHPKKFRSPPWIARSPPDQRFFCALRAISLVIEIFSQK